MKKIIGVTFYDLIKYGSNIDTIIKKNDMELLSSKIETKMTHFTTVLFFQKNFITLSSALFLMMISWIFIIVTALKGINTKESPGLYFGLYMLTVMPYVFFYIASVFLIARGITLGLKLIHFTFMFILVMATVFSLYYLNEIFLSDVFSTSDVVNVTLIILPLYFCRLILNTNLIKTAVLWTINERARKEYLKLFLANYQSPRKKRKLRVG
ncbi:hypothetical protein [Rahnella sikkimica]|uniref:Uncharacterized protein n=1 Tax=Rahnella sikkimica TaxID=1805933 RepID=A0A2L1UVL6_9GAMM|nr:hypothetical protein [Rahnella sikkimica]AVF36951.1 hypothetical protein BV494_19400 [Rahnella sikkimica]